MHRIDNGTAVAVLPVPRPDSGHQGFFTNGDPARDIPATEVDDDWLNMIQEELANVVLAAGLTLDKTKQNQLLQAIQHLSAVVDATEAQAGIARIATAAEAAAGVNDDTIITPAKLANALSALDFLALADFTGENQLLSENGYQKLPGGLIFQWGRKTTTAATDQSVAFPIVFPNSVFLVVGNSGSGSENFTVACYSKTLTGFLTKTQNAASGAMSAGVVNWIAIGY